MSRVQIVGAGMAGLLAGGMLRDEVLAIFESQPGLPNNHTALLRFRSSAVGDVLNIPFKKVRVMKAVDSQGMNPIAAMLAYSRKTNGTATMRSSISANGDIDERFIAPVNLVEQMANKLNQPVTFGFNWNGPSDAPTISTLPMPILMDILGWNGDVPDFLSVSGYNITADLLDTDAYCTLYIPDQLRQENRISITGSRLTIEVALPRLTEDEVRRVFGTKSSQSIFDQVDYAMTKLGLPPTSVIYSSVRASIQRYAKILPIDESIRQRFIMWASDVHGVFSLGRFATWRPGLLLDDVVHDVRVIHRLINGSDTAYSNRKR